MAFCYNCGQPIDDDAQFCSNCGANQNPAAAAPQAAPQPSAASEFMEKVKAFIVKLLDTPDYTPSYDPADAKGGMVMAILAYLSWLVLIPLFVEKKSAFARYHTNQGLILHILSTVYGLATGIVAAVIGLLVPVLGAILGWIFGLAGIVFLAYMALGIYNAATGKAKELPYIGKYRILD